MRRLVCTVLIAWLCQGCFVLDELDKGNELLDEHSGRSRGGSAEASSEAPSAGGGEEIGLLARAQAWWKKQTEPKPPERDPEDIVVRCEVGGSLQFTRKFDCQVKGGKVL